MIRILLTELRRSPARLVFPFLVLADLLIVWRDSGFWAGNWQATSLYVQSATILVAPFLAACAAWAAQRNRRSGHDAIAATMPRSPGAPVAAQWAAVAAWGLLAYAVGLVAAAVKTAPAAGGPWWSLLLLGAIAVCAYSAVGFAAGALWAWRGVAPLAGVLVYGWIVALSQTHWGARLGLVVGDQLLPPSRELSASALATAAAWGVALAAVAAAAASFARRSGLLRRRLLWPVATAAAAVAAMAMLAGPGELRQRAPTAGQVCAGLEPRVCVWPEHAKYARPAAQVAGRLAVALRGIVRFPGTVYEEGLGVASAPGASALRVDTLPVTRASLVGRLARGVLPAMPPRCPADMGPRLERFVLIKAWLEMRAAGALASDVYTDGAALQSLLDRSDAAQRTWVRKNLPAATSCSAPLRSTRAVSPGVIS